MIELMRGASFAESDRVTSGPSSGGSTLTALCLLAALAPLVFAVRLFEPYTATKEILIQTGTATAALIWLLTARANSWSLQATPAWIPLLALALLGTASSLWSSSPSVSLLEAQRLATYVLLFAVALHALRQNDSRAALAAALVLAGGVEAVYVLLQYSFGDPIFLTGNLSGKWQTFGTFGNPNWTGEFLAVTCLVSMGRLTDLHRKGPADRPVLSFTRHWTLLALIMMLLALTATLARGAWAAFIIGAFAFLTVRRYSDVRWALRSFILPLAASVAAAVILIVLPLLTNRESINHLLNLKSIRGRLLMWDVTVSMIRDMPWTGHGLATFGLKFPLYQADVLSQPWASSFIPNASFPSFAHNDYLQLWAELGLFGLIAFGSLVWIVLKRGRTLAGDPVALGCWAAVISLLVNAAVAFPLHLPTSLMLFVVLLAVVEATAARRMVTLHRQSVALRVGVMLIVMTLCFSAYRFSYDRLLTEAALWQADAALGRGRLDEAEASARTAIRRAPTRLDGFAMLGRLHLERGEYQEALLALNEAQSLGFDVEIYYVRATALEATGERTAAIATLKELVRLRPDLQWARNRLLDLSIEAEP